MMYAISLTLKSGGTSTVNAVTTDEMNNIINLALRRGAIITRIERVTK